MKYLSFVRSPEQFRSTPPPPALMEAMGKLIEKYSRTGALVDTGGLAPSKDGFIMRAVEGKLRVIDGPFTEAKEVIGGWAILEAKSRDEAVQFTREFMELHLTHWPEFVFECEVRPIEFLASDQRPR